MDFLGRDGRPDNCYRVTAQSDSLECQFPALGDDGKELPKDNLYLYLQQNPSGVTTGDGYTKITVKKYSKKIKSRLYMYAVF